MIESRSTSCWSVIVVVIVVVAVWRSAEVAQKESLGDLVASQEKKSLGEGLGRIRRLDVWKYDNSSQRGERSQRGDGNLSERSDSPYPWVQS